MWLSAVSALEPVRSTSWGGGAGDLICFPIRGYLPASLLLSCCICLYIFPDTLLTHPLCHAVSCCVLQHHIQAGALEQGFSLLLEALPRDSSGGSSAWVRPWLSLLVAAAAAGQVEMYSNVCEVMDQWAQGHTQTIDMAWVSVQTKSSRQLRYPMSFIHSWR